MRRMTTEYAIYNGDEFVMIGTAGECAAKLGVKPATIYFLSSSPAYVKRIEQRKKAVNYYIAVKLELEEDDLDQ
jgi:hypothetical protein